MSKISRREFLKRLSFIGAIVPFVDKLSQNLPDFTTEQLEELSKVKEVPQSYYIENYVEKPDLWHITLKDGTQSTMRKSEMVYRYGNVDNYLRKNDDAYMVWDDYSDKAWLND